MSDDNSTEKTKFEIVENVFEALGIDNPEEEMARCESIARIFQIGQERNLKDAALAKLAACKPKRFALLRALEFDDFTMDELNGYLAALGEDA